MARVIVLPDSPDLRKDVPAGAAFIEEVMPDHLDDEPSAVQLLQRLEWAIRESSARLDGRSRTGSRRGSGSTRQGAVA